MGNNYIQFLLVVLIMSSTDVLSSNYLAYISIVVLFLLNARTFSINCCRYAVYAFLIVILFSLIKFCQLTQDSFKDLGLMFLGVLCFLNRTILDINIKKLNVVLALCFCFCFITKEQDFSLSLQTLINSDMGFESPMYSFIFPFFYFYWLGRDKKFTFLNFAIVMLAGKRIGMLSILLISLYYLSLKNDKLSKFTSSSFFYISFNVVFVILSYVFLSGLFDDYVYDLTGVSANALTMGRQDLYQNVFFPKDHDLAVVFLWGIGVGNITSYINYGGELLHNDVLRLLIENGILITILFFSFLYRVTDKYVKGFVILWNIILLTDNTLIYPQVIFTFFLLMFLYEQQIISNNNELECDE